MLGRKQEHDFDPIHDVTRYVGPRPFANFVAKGVTLYAHPELLDDNIRLKLLATSLSSSQNPAEETKEPREFTEGLEHGKKKKKTKTKKQNDDDYDDDDGFL